MLIEGKETAYDLGDKVYLVTDPVQDDCLVVGIIIEPNGIKYRISADLKEYECFNIEISPVKTIY